MSITCGRHWLHIGRSTVPTVRACHGPATMPAYQLSRSKVVPWPKSPSTVSTQPERPKPRSNRSSTAAALACHSVANTRSRSIPSTKDRISQTLALSRCTGAQVHTPTALSPSLPCRAATMAPCVPGSIPTYRGNPPGGRHKAPASGNSCSSVPSDSLLEPLPTS